VSDLQCPVQVLVARHGEADYETDRLSDHGGTLSPMSRAVQTAEIVAAAQGCDVTVREGLREFGVGVHAGHRFDPDPAAATFVRWLAGDLTERVEGAESGAEVIGRFAVVLEEIADLHRGEAVLVVSHGGAICTGVPALAHNLTAGFP